MIDPGELTDSILNEQWRRWEIIALLYAYVHGGHSGRRFRFSAEALEALEIEYRAEWEDLSKRPTTAAPLAATA